MSDTTTVPSPTRIRIRKRRAARDHSATINAQLDELRTATSAKQVLAILSLKRSPVPAGTGCCCGGSGFFAGTGGDRTVRESLGEAGWRTTWSQRPDFYVMRAPDGSAITYVEGDVFHGDYSYTARS